jgi:hypothetical protein
MISDSNLALKFWQSKLGKERINKLVSAQSGNRPSHQILIEISREEMRQLLDEEDNEDDEADSDNMED